MVVMTKAETRREIKRENEVCEFTAVSGSAPP